MIRKVQKAFGKIRDGIHVNISSGSNVYCSMCGWKGRGFKKDGSCPSCHSRERQRLISYCARVFGLGFDRKSLLHIGPSIEEVAWVLDRFMPHPYYRCDLVLRRLVNFPCDAQSISLPDESVDYALSWHVLEHIPEDRQVIREIYRTLRPGGQFLVSVPITPPGRIQTYEDSNIPREKFLEVHGHYDHVRSCGLDYSDRFCEAGFAVEALRVKDGVGASDKAFFGLSDKHVAWCCTKPSRPMG